MAAAISTKVWQAVDSGLFPILPATVDQKHDPLNILKQLPGELIILSQKALVIFLERRTQASFKLKGIICKRDECETKPIDIWISQVPFSIKALNSLVPNPLSPFLPHPVSAPVFHTPSGYHLIAVYDSADSNALSYLEKLATKEDRFSVEDGKEVLQFMTDIVRIAKYAHSKGLRLPPLDLKNIYIKNGSTKQAYIRHLLPNSHPKREDIKMIGALFRLILSDLRAFEKLLVTHGQFDSIRLC